MSSHAVYLFHFEHIHLSIRDQIKLIELAQLEVGLEVVDAIGEQ